MDFLINLGFALVIIVVTIVALTISRARLIPVVAGIAAAIGMAIWAHSWLFIVWAGLIAVTLYFIFTVTNWPARILWGLICLVVIIGGFLVTTPYVQYVPVTSEETPINVEATPAATEAAADPAYVCVDPSAIPYGSYALVAEKAITGPAIVEWWDQTPATLDEKTGKLDLSAMKGHEGIQFVMSGETITPARNIVGTVFVLTSDNDLLCVKNRHLLAFYSKPQHIYATSPEELVLPVPLAPAQ